MKKYVCYINAIYDKIIDGLYIRTNYEFTE